jgi:TolA-binding protein
MLLLAFDQLASLITNLTSEFTNSIKLMVEKFESINYNRIDKLETQIFHLNDKVESFQKNVDNLTKTNNNLKQLLSDSYINKIQEQEVNLANDFEISGFSDVFMVDGITISNSLKK